MVILVASLLVGRPDLGIELVALWTLLSLIFHAVRLAQANARRDRGAAGDQLADMTRWTALVLAGSRPGADPFAEAHGIDLKALIPVGGVPMVQRPVSALLASPEVSQVHVLTQQPDRIAGALPTDPRLSVEPSGSTIAATLAAFFNNPIDQLSATGHDR